MDQPDSQAEKPAATRANGADKAIKAIEAETDGLPLRPHRKMGFLGGSGLILFFIREILISLPTLVRTRGRYRLARQGKAPGDLRVAWVGSNLDEVNGIALSSRKLLRVMRREGKAIWMYGVAFHNKAPRVEDPQGAVIMAPGPYSVDQAGYASSELAIVDLRHFCAFILEHQIDVVEFETPGPVEGLCLWACRILGVKTCSHYRTDILTYASLLVDNRVGVWCIQTWTRWLTRLAGPVVVPSLAYRDKVAAMGIAPERITRLARGVDLASFNPDRRSRDAWKARGLPEVPCRLLYVGRVSKEKHLEALVEALLALGPRSDLHLAVVGDGPYREEMEARLRPQGIASFTGVLSGEDLYDIYAAGDLFVFPSLTDTFGNSVVEALASGLPCLVSDQGGPCEIVRDGQCGYVFATEDKNSFARTLAIAIGDKHSREELRIAARTRAKQFTYENSAQEFWAFYQRLQRGSATTLSVQTA